MIKKNFYSKFLTISVVFVLSSMPLIASGLHYSVDASYIISTDIFQGTIIYQNNVATIVRKIDNLKDDITASFASEANANRVQRQVLIDQRKQFGEKCEEIITQELLPEIRHMNVMRNLNSKIRKVINNNENYICSYVTALLLLNEKNYKNGNSIESYKSLNNNFLSLAYRLIYNLTAFTESRVCFNIEQCSDTQALLSLYQRSFIETIKDTTSFNAQLLKALYQKLFLQECYRSLNGSSMFYQPLFNWCVACEQEETVLSWGSIISIHFLNNNYFACNRVVIVSVPYQKRRADNNQCIKKQISFKEIEHIVNKNDFFYLAFPSNLGTLPKEIYRLLRKKTKFCIGMSSSSKLPVRTDFVLIDCNERT